MAEQGDISGRKRGYAGTWPPRTAAPIGGLAPSRPAFWPPIVETRAHGPARKPARAACCPGCRSPSAPASPFTSPPITSRFCRWPPSSPSRYVRWRYRCGDKILSPRRHDRSRRRRLCDRDLEDRADRAWRASAAGAGEISVNSCNVEDDAFEALVAGVAKTLPGLLAWLAYLQELDAAFETEWMITERVFTPTLIKSFVAALKNVGVQA